VVTTDEAVRWIEFQPVYGEPRPDADPPPPRGATSSTSHRTAVGWTVMVIGSLGVLLGLVMVLLALLLTGRVADGVRDGLVVAEDTLVSISETVDLAETTIGTTADSLSRVEAALARVTRSVGSVDMVLDDMAAVLGEDIPDSLDLLRSSFPGLIEVGDAIDETLRALAFFGVPYDAQQSIGDSFREMDDALVDVPDRLREQAVLLTGMRGDVRASADDAARIRQSLSTIRTQLTTSKWVLGRYRNNIADAGRVVADVQTKVGTGEWIARWALVAVGLVFMASQLVTVYFGWRIRRGDL
jgi:hypothetical protein